jgi:hypothetical protein
MKVISGMALVFGVIFTLTVISCKKEDKEPAPVPTPSNILGSPYQTYSYFRTGYSVTESNGVVYVDSNLVFAMFYDQPTYPNNKIPAGDVSINTISLTPDQSNFYQYQFLSGPINISNTLHWNVTGAGTITAFTHSYAPSYPHYSGADQLPDTCVKANGLSVTIAGVSNRSGIIPGLSILVYQSSPTYVQINKSTQTSSGTVSFSASELAGFDTGESLYLVVSINNYNSVNVANVYRAFSCDYQYTKEIYFK